MKDFVAYPSRRRIALLIIAGMAFVVAGLWMAGMFGPPPASRRYSPAFVHVIGWLTTLFFGFGMVLSIRRLFDQRVQVRIDPEGVFSVQWSEQIIPWSEIVDVTTWSHKGQKAIVLHLRDKALFPGRGMAGKLASLNRSLTGGDISITLTGTNKSVEDALLSVAHFRSPEVAL